METNTTMLITASTLITTSTRTAASALRPNRAWTLGRVVPTCVNAIAGAHRAAAIATFMGGVSFAGVGLGHVDESTRGSVKPFHTPSDYDTRTGTDWSPPV